VRKTEIQRVEELAAELHGPAAAVSQDREPPWWHARVWDAKGANVVEVGSLTSARDALSMLAASLRDRLRSRGSK
jgi:hypothetical protein